jgi:hypothetical protein
MNFFKHTQKKEEVEEESEDNHQLIIIYSNTLKQSECATAQVMRGEKRMTDR